MSNNSTTDAESSQGANQDLKGNDLVTRSIGVGSDLLGVDVGDEFWLPVSPIRGDNFRAIRVEVKERRSAGRYEEKHAIEPWDEDAKRLGADPTLVSDGGAAGLTDNIRCSECGSIDTDFKEGTVSRRNPEHEAKTIVPPKRKCNDCGYTWEYE